MKKLAIAVCVLAAVNLTACTQYKSMKHEKQKEYLIEDTINATDPSDRAAIITSKMVEALGLNEAQRVKVALLNEDFSNRYSVLAASNNPKINKRKEFIKLTDEKNQELKKVFNNAQVTKWNEIRKEFWDEYRML
ncbi:hypothetical protein GCM10009133_12310 [Cocleimonas flava]|uniref:Lipoprotein n=1 Tax=Cocleimonas flava TaxID=634765 RepID=A0A4R1F080_9GAMM|nr:MULTISPECIES: hypothetical protein [Cocleimonas]MEB8434369.1 hypothetical protein [Cocleimonas sp. KMM 6892]MEC4717228.1 hypothetical protein [Cocleimonas sp. KMM 6895]MEC4746607.1 hypothetical protein [Cocleimonas sp. KMM 6896]TCJ87596.1 hypothetical protein EV695_2108 [Cocleimonas flava]